MTKIDKLNPYVLSAFFALVSGFAVAGATDHIDMSVPPQQDFYGHANGGWNNGKEQCGIRGEAKREIEQKIDGCLDTIISSRQDSDIKDVITKLYTSLTNPEDNKLKLSVIGEAAFIDQMTKNNIPTILGHLNSIGVPVFVDIGIRSVKSDGLYIETGFITPGKIPYNITETDIMNLFQKSGLSPINYNIATNVLRIRNLEQQTADLFTKDGTTKRQQDSKYILFPMHEIPNIKPWEDYLITSELNEKKQFVRYAPSYFTLLSKNIFSQLDLDDLKIYLKFRLLYSYRGALFDKNSTSDIARNKQALQQINDSLSYELPRLCFASEINRNKVKIDAIFANIKTAYDREIDSIYWMNPETKLLAHKRLAEVNPEFAYPPELEKKLDNSELSSDDPVHNLRLINNYHYVQLKVKRIGQPTNSAYLNWVNIETYGTAIYYPKSNAISLPLKYLFPPYFQVSGNPDHDNALNYGGLGFILGHELSHNLQPGNLKISAEEMEIFKNDVRDKLIKQFLLYNHGGPSTVMENIADILGLKMSGDAYKMTLVGKSAPIFSIELADKTEPLNKTMLWLSGNQLRYYNFAEIWRDKDDECNGNRHTHSLNYDRVNGTLMNNDDFQDEFETKPENKMYLAPNQRIRILRKDKN